MCKRTTALILVVVIGLAACSSETKVVPIETGGSGASAAGISVSGIGEVQGTPDTLTFTVGVQVTRDSVSEAISESSVKTEAIIDALEAEGVDSDDIQTANLSIYPEYDWTEQGRRLLGYTASNTVEAKIRSVDSAGDVIDAAVSAGGDETIVQGIGFSVEDDLERLEAARARAWADAEAKAQQLADLAGVDLGEVTRVSEGLESSSPFDLRVSDVAFEEAGAVAIEPGQVTTRVVLAVVFAIS